MQMSLRLPREPGRTEAWWFTVMPKSFTPEQRRAAKNSSPIRSRPAGLLEQDDENWSQSTLSSRGVVSRRYPHNMQMALGQDEVLVDPTGRNPSRSS